MFLLIIGICIGFTVVQQFPDGVKLDSEITYFDEEDTPDEYPDAFEQSEVFLEFFLYNYK